MDGPGLACVVEVSAQVPAILPHGVQDEKHDIFASVACGEKSFWLTPTFKWPFH